MEFDLSTKGSTESEQVFAVKANVDIWVAEDYEKFSLSDFNRDPGHYQKIVESIREIDWTKYNPILVAEDDSKEKLVIVDGQNRFLACRELGLPIYFIYSEEMTIMDAPGINKASKNWSTLDYVRHYAVRGREQYIKVLDYMHKYNQRLSVIVSFGKMIGGTGSNKKMVEDGDFSFRDDIDIDKFFEHMEIFQQYYNFARKDRFVKAMLKLYMHKNYDESVMLRKLKLAYNIVRDQPRLSMMVDELLKLYNYKSKAPIKF